MSQLELLRQQEMAFVELVENAGAKIMAIYHEDDFEVQMKGANDPLTKADLAANQIIVEGLKILCPTIPVLSEESINTFADGERPVLYWAVDPLDGTKEFIKRNGEFTVNLALIENGVPIFGIVMAPALDVIYRGWVGYGAWKNSSKSPNWEEISASKLRSINENNPVRVVGSRSHADPKMALWLERYQPHHLIGVGSSLKFCMVAEGVADIYPRHGTTCIWDTAAGHAVLAAAGGDVFQLDGELLTYTEPAQTKNASFVALANRMMFLEYEPFE
jgi:3'(2'), 5'-bisphosphate nucleotidase